MPFVENVKPLARGYGYMVKIPGREKTFVITVVTLNWNMNSLDGQKFLIPKFTECGKIVYIGIQLGPEVTEFRNTKLGFHHSTTNSSSSRAIILIR